MKESRGLFKVKVLAVVVLSFCAALALLASCGGSSNGNEGQVQPSVSSSSAEEAAGEEASSSNAAEEAESASSSSVTAIEERAGKPSKENTLEQSFPQADALKAAVVALTNATASDVFASEGNSHDTSKYHSYPDRSGEYLDLVSDGTWWRYLTLTPDLLN